MANLLIRTAILAVSWYLPAIHSPAICPAQDQKKRVDVEGQIRAASMQYYSSMIFADFEIYQKVSRSPVAVLRDGALTHRDETAAKKLIGQLAEKLKSSKLSDEDRRQMVGNMVRVFEEASVQFVGASTAELTFLIRPGAKKEDGDSLGTFVLHRSGDQWRVVMEITDSAPVPPAYLQDVPKDSK